MQVEIVEGLDTGMRIGEIHIPENDITLYCIKFNCIWWRLSLGLVSRNSFSLFWEAEAR